MREPSVSPATRLVAFVGGGEGSWQVEQIHAVVGVTLPAVTRLAVVADGDAVPAGGLWSVRGTTSNDRYVERDEKRALVQRQQGLGRESASLAALIPIRKKAAWWALAQDERRAIFEAQSKHIGIGMRYLPAIARRLHHCRDLGPNEPFDFLTWFEYAPEDAPAFEMLLRDLRSTAEWTYVEHEIDIRLSRASGDV